MPEATNISREELLELATADAMGVLEDVDSARFEKAFAAASPSMQAEIRALQDRLCSDPAFLSDGQPPASLRLKTLARVAEAVEENGAAPIATIGPARARTQQRQAVDRDALVREILERTALERRPTQHIWRAAALFLFAALVVALYFNAQQREISSRMMDFVDRKLVDDAMRQIARGTKGFDFEHAREVRVLDERGTPVRLVHAYLDEANGRVCVVGFGLDIAATSVRVTRPDATKPDGSQITLASAVVEDRGFTATFAIPEGAASVRLEVGNTPMTIMLSA